MSRSSITTEIDALHPVMNTTGRGLMAFRFGDAAVREHAEQIDTNVPLHLLVELALDTPSENSAVEQLKADYPDEFALGAAINAYKIRSASRAQEARGSAA